MFVPPAWSSARWRPGGRTAGRRRGAVIVLGEPRRQHRLRRRRHADDLQHQHRGRRRVRRSAGVRAGAHRLQLPRSGRPDRRRPRLRQDLRRRQGATGPRLRDQRRRCVLRRQADHLRRHGAGLGIAVRSVPRVRRGQPCRLQRHRIRRLRPGAEEGAGVLRAGSGFRRLRPVVRRDVDDAVARHRRRAGHRRHVGHHQQRRTDGRTHRPGVEHHLEFDCGPRHQEVPVVGALQARLRDRGRRGRTRRQRQMVGSTTRHPQDHGVAQGRRHPGSHQPERLRHRRCRGRIVGHIEPAGRLRPDRLAVRGHRAAHLRLPRRDVPAAGAARAGPLHAA